jgi:hypothetical protein
MKGLCIASLHNPRLESLACPSARALMRTFIAATHYMNELSEQQVMDALAGDDDFCRFDLLIYEASELRQNAKYALMRYVGNIFPASTI